MNRTFGKEVALIIIKAAVIVCTILAVIIGSVAFFDSGLGISDGTCNIAVLPIEGEIWPFYGLSHVPLIVTPDMVEDYLLTAEKDESIQGILLEINSPGGLPAASERIAERVRTGTLPSVGLIGDLGASGGYMVAAAADHLIASPYSIVGSIGVNASYVENSKQNEDEGLTYVQLIAGEYKDVGDPNKPLTDDERALIQRDLDAVHARFIEQVARYRSLPIEQVTTLADGSTFTGMRAKEANLVDGVGGRSEAREAFAKMLSLDVADIHFCEYSAPILPL